VPRSSPAPTAAADPVGPLPRLEPGPPSTPTALTEDPHWRRALERDPIDLARLADREGALGLLAAVELGGSLGLTGLQALPYAEDGELALGRLCELLPRLPEPGRRAVLVALHSIVQKLVVARADRERLAAEAVGACRSALTGVAKQAEASPDDRDLAASARELLREAVE
jgi:hypothetical protein